MDFWNNEQAGVQGHQLCREYLIRGSETDVRDEIHLETLFSIFQEISSLHSADLGVSADITDNLNVVWMLTGYTLRLKSLPKWREQVSCKTWILPVDRLFFPREIAIYDEVGKVHCFCAATWFLADRTNHRPARPEKIAEVYNEYIGRREPVMGQHALRMRRNLTPNLADREPVITRVTGYSDQDRNHHINNTRYVAWSVDAVYFLQKNQGDYKVTGLDIYFVSEAYVGETIEVFAVPIQREKIIAEYPTFVPAGGELSYEVECRTIEGKTVYRALVHLKDLNNCE